MAIHCGLFRCSRRVLETNDPPWFGCEYSADGCDLAKCPGVYFRDTALAAGFTVARDGHCLHAPIRSAEVAN